MAQLNLLLASFVDGWRDQIVGPACGKQCRFQQVVAGLPGLEPRLEGIPLLVGESLVRLAATSANHHVQPS